MPLKITAVWRQLKGELGRAMNGKALGYAQGEGGSREEQSTGRNYGCGERSWAVVGMLGHFQMDRQSL